MSEAVNYYDTLLCRTGSHMRESRTYSAICDARIMLSGYKKPSRRICCSSDLEIYCRELLQNEAMESFRIICVDAQCRLLGESEISSGSLSEVSAYPRKVATIALLMNAHSVFFAHNHPGGTCAPSKEDVESTIQLKKLFRAFQIHVLDHMIVTPDGDCYSMSRHGDL